MLWLAEIKDITTDRETGEWWRLLKI